MRSTSACDHRMGPCPYPSRLTFFLLERQCVMSLKTIHRESAKSLPSECVGPFQYRNIGGGNGGSLPIPSDHPAKKKQSGKRTSRVCWQHPIRAYLDGHSTTVRQEVLDWLRNYKRLMGKKSMVCEGDSKHARDQVKTKGQRQVGPSETERCGRT